MLLPQEGSRRIPALRHAISGRKLICGTRVVYDRFQKEVEQKKNLLIYFKVGHMIMQYQIWVRTKQIGYKSDGIFGPKRARREENRN
jgi:hypothetical protein